MMQRRIDAAIPRPRCFFLCTVTYVYETHTNSGQWVTLGSRSAWKLRAWRTHMRISSATWKGSASRTRNDGHPTTRKGASTRSSARYYLTARRAWMVVVNQSDRRGSSCASIIQQLVGADPRQGRTPDFIKSGQAACRYTTMDHRVRAAAMTRLNSPSSNAGMNHTSSRNSSIDSPVI